MKLGDYLDRFAWSQAQLAREAGVSPQSVARALKGEKISRRNAEAILTAIQRKYKDAGLKGAITMASVKGLHISDLRHKQRKPTTKQELAASDPEGESEGR